MPVFTKLLGICAAGLGFVSAFSGCTGVVGSKDVTRQPLRLGFVLATMNEERYAKDRTYFTDFAKAQGAEVEFASCNDKVDIQKGKIETLLAGKIDALVIQPVNGDAIASVVQLAKKKGIPVIAYDRLITHADIDAYVTQNSFKVGVLQAEAAVEATQKKGNFVILMGEAGHSVTDEITRGNLSVLSKYPQIKIVVQRNHPGWSTALALSTVEDALARFHGNIQAVLANNDGMALGALQAIEERKLVGKVFVAGADADLGAVKDVLKGRQSMTVLKGIKPLAEAAVTVALSLAKKETLRFDSKKNNGFKDVPVVNTAVFKIVKSNIQQEVVERGFHTAESLYEKPVASSGSGTNP